MKRLTKLSATVAATALIASLSACGGQDPTSQTESALGIDKTKKGPAKRIFAALRSLELSAAQRATVDKLEAQFKTEITQLKSEGVGLANEIARQIRAGDLNEAAILARVKKLSALAKSKKPKLAVALNTLHQTLDQSQRRTLVRKLRAAAKKRREARRKGMRGKIRGLAKKLGVDDNQRQQLRNIVIAQVKGNKESFRANKQPQKGGSRAIGLQGTPRRGAPQNINRFPWTELS
jgi:Spy/CpxP family protein refolding chaperone